VLFAFVEGFFVTLSVSSCRTIFLRLTKTKFYKRTLLTPNFLETYNAIYAQYTVDKSGFSLHLVLHDTFLRFSASKMMKILHTEQLEDSTFSCGRLKLRLRVVNSSLCRTNI
jgi:hypothetical protein